MLESINPCVDTDKWQELVLYALNTLVTILATYAAVNTNRNKKDVNAAHAHLRELDKKLPGVETGTEAS